MEFSNRNVQSQAAAPGAQGSAARDQGKKNNPSDNGKLGRVVVAVATVLVAVVLVALIALIVKGGDKQETKYVNNQKLQAVFLNTGQVYFGNIKTLNNKYVVLTNIYYLQTSGTGDNNTNTNVSLVKLGCELHEPYDQMVINRDQVTFWENLQDNGQVATAVSTFKKQNPEGQKCADQSTSSSTNSSTNAQPATNNSSTSNTNSSNR